MRRRKVLFVCTGNICRSPTAEGVFRQQVQTAGLAERVQMDSAGTHGYHVGEAPDARSLLAARRRNYDLSRLRARQIVLADFGTFDYVLAMDNGHLALLHRLSPQEHRHKIQLFLDFAPHLAQREIPDPYYGGASGFELVLNLAEQAAGGLLDHIKRELESETPERQNWPPGTESKLGD